MLVPGANLSREVSDMMKLSHFPLRVAQDVEAVSLVQQRAEG